MIKKRRIEFQYGLGVETLIFAAFLLLCLSCLSNVDFDKTDVMYLP